MAIFNVNQNNQFYVVSTVVTETPANEGEVQVVKNINERQVAFKHFGKGGLTRTDLIDLDKVCYATLTDASKMRRKAKKAVISLSTDVNGGKPVIGQDYVVRVHINKYFSPGEASVYVKVGAVRATKAMVDTPKIFYDKLKESLERSFSREEDTFLTFESSESGITLNEYTNQPWRLGILSQDAVDFEVFPSTIRLNGEDVIWATVDENTNRVAITEGTEEVKNGKQIADLEYFCMAERGDRHRNMGYPYNIDVKMMVDPTKEYHVLTVHYYYNGSGVQVHKSEKDITFVSTDKSVLESIKENFE